MILRTSVRICSEAEWKFSVNAGVSCVSSVLAVSLNVRPPVAAVGLPDNAGRSREHTVNARDPWLGRRAPRRSWRADSAPRPDPAGSWRGRPGIRRAPLDAYSQRPTDRRKRVALRGAAARP